MEVTSDHLVNMTDPITRHDLVRILRAVIERYDREEEVPGQRILASAAAAIMHSVIEDAVEWGKLRKKLNIEVSVATPKELAAMRSALLEVRGGKEEPK